MRYLQVEWHNHERARNAWDIERAEMKAKIAKQEGEVRHSRRLNDQLTRQIKMLEMALRNERKHKTGAAASFNDTVDATPTRANPMGTRERSVAHKDKGRSGLSISAVEI